MEVIDVAFDAAGADGTCVMEGATVFLHVLPIRYNSLIQHGHSLHFHSHFYSLQAAVVVPVDKTPADCPNPGYKATR